MWPLIRQLKQLPSSCIRFYLNLWGPSQALSDQGANFMSSIIDEMCKLLGMKKLWTMPYHPQDKWLMERSHQTIMQMIRKLGEDKKSDWPGHLTEIVHTYSAASFAVMGYNPHFLMFGCRPRLPVDFYFPTVSSAEVPKRGVSAKCVDEYMSTVSNWLRATLWEAQAQSMAEAQWQKWYYNWKIGAVDLKPGDHVLVKADTFQRKRKIKDRWEDKPHEVVHQITTDIPSYEVMEQYGQSCIQLLIISETVVPLCVGVCQAWDRCTSPTPVKPTPRGNDSDTMLREDGGLAITQCQARKTSLGWINGKLQLLPWMFIRASTDDGWRLQVMCSGSWCLQDHMHLVEE